MEKDSFFESMEVDTQQEAMAMIEQIADLMVKGDSRNPNHLVSLCIQVADEVGAQPRFQLIECCSGRCKCGRWDMQYVGTPYYCSSCQREDEEERGIHAS